METLMTANTILREHYVNFLVALVEHGNMPLSSWEEEPHHVRLITGCEDEELNAIFSLEEPLVDQAKIKQYIQRMKSTDLPFTWVIPETENFLQMETLLFQNGLIKQSASQGMIGLPNLSVEPLNSEVTIRPVRTESQLNTWLDIYEKSFFNEPIPLLKQLFRKVFLDLGLTNESPFRPDLAFLDNQPVGANLLFFSHDNSVGGFWCTSVLPQARGKGVAKVLIHTAMQNMIDRGTTYSVTWLDQTGTLFPYFSKLNMQTQLRLCTFSSEG